MGNIINRFKSFFESGPSIKNTWKFIEDRDVPNWVTSTFRQKLPGPQSRSQSHKILINGKTFKYKAEYEENSSYPYKAKVQFYRVLKK